LAATPGIGSDNLRSVTFKQSKTPQSSGASFELPPAAIDPKAKVSEDQQRDDRTPLLEATRPRQNTPRLQLTSASEIHQRKQKTLSTSNGPGTYSGGSVVLNEGYQMEAMNDTSISEFTEWLDKQLLMIDTFYREREEHILERYLLLQDQLFHLREEKLRFKAKGKPDTDEFLKLGLAKTTSKLTKLSKIDLPSLPSNPFKKHKSSEADRANGKKDYERKHEVPYYMARRRLKIAVQEHYRELELLKSYRMLNRTGFRKLLKKFDKRLNTNLSATYMEKVNSSYFASSDVLENMTPKVEDMYSTSFENGNRKIAVEKLRSNLGEDHFYSTVFLTGISYGLAVPLFAYAVYLGIHKTYTGEIPMGRYILQIWAGFFLLLLMAMLAGINCLMWAKFKINYRFIFELNPKTALNYREYSFIPSILFFSLSLFLWLGFNNFWPEAIPSRFWPWFFFASALMIIFMPFDVLFLETRKWLIIAMWRLFFAGFYPVEFRDFFLGDIFCSLTYTMGNLSFFFCMYATDWQGAIEGNPGCGSSKSRLMGFFATLPPIWRFLQCLRRYADSGDWFPHLANMAKYSITIVYYATLSVYRIDSTLRNRAVFIFFAIVNSVYSGLWDIFMDWSLMQNKWLLRDDIVYPAWWYYFSMVSDIALRFQWIFYALFNRQIGQSAITSFCIGVAEIVRRFIWLSIRLENEHVGNIHLFKASREVPLPYTTILRSSRQPSSEEPSEGATTGYLSIHRAVDEEQQQPERTPSSMGRRGTVLNSEVFRTVTRAIVNAHAKDFQRKKSQVNEMAEGDNSSDDNSDDGA
jgi:hypothetical protein